MPERAWATVATPNRPDARVSVWTPDSAPRAVVQIFHGMAEHIERYDRTARDLVARGYAVAGHDHMGHGPGTPEGNISQAIGRANDAANDANSAAERAEEAADAAEGFAAAIAPTFEEVMADNPFTPISANTQHVWHNGQIYVNIVDINSAEAWAGDHWAATDVSGELAKCYHESDAATTAETLSYLNL